MAATQPAGPFRGLTFTIKLRRETKMQNGSKKVALVTGANKGIGLGMAEGLAQAGAVVEIWGTSAERNAAAVAKLAAPSVNTPVSPTAPIM